MIRKKIQDIQWLEFPLFHSLPHFKHAIFLRHDKPYLIEHALDIPPPIGVNQVHGTDLVWVKDPTEQIPPADILITQTLSLPLMIKHADCQATIFYDQITHSLAVAHAGWRGNVQNVYGKTVEGMRNAFGTQPQDLLVGIGPSLGPQHAEFKNYRTEFPEEFWQFQVKPNYFDLWSLARFQLEKCGIQPDHIEIARICTYANAPHYYSYRRDKTSSRHATRSHVIAYLRVSI